MGPILAHSRLRVRARALWDVCVVVVAGAYNLHGEAHIGWQNLNSQTIWNEICQWMGARDKMELLAASGTFGACLMRFDGEGDGQGPKWDEQCAAVVNSRK